MYTAWLRVCMCWGGQYGDVHCMVECVLGVSVVMYTAWLSVCVGGQCGDVHCMVECVCWGQCGDVHCMVESVCWGSVWQCTLHG